MLQYLRYSNRTLNKRVQYMYVIGKGNVNKACCKLGIVNTISLTFLYCEHHVFGQKSVANVRLFDRMQHPGIFTDNKMLNFVEIVAIII